LGEILNELFAARGWSRLRAAGELEEAWERAVGESRRGQTRVGAIRRGVLSVTVANSALLEELAVFEKPALLAALRKEATGSRIQDIRFRLGSVRSANLEHELP
jgi:hypothetical protein